MPLNNFGIVVPGSMFRCAQPDAKGFADLQTLGVTDVVMLNADDYADNGDFEQRICDALSIVLHRVPDGAFHRLAPSAAELRTVADQIQVLHQAGRVVAVHCTHGRDGTGGGIAAWRIVHCGWTFDDADSERRLYGSEFVLEKVDALIVAALKELAEAK